MRSDNNNTEDGQIMILTALLMSALLIVSAFAIDGGFGLFQAREAQNAADFAALAASKLTPCNSGNSTVTGTQMQQTVQNIVNDNYAGNATTSWTAKYLDGSGNPLPGDTFSNTTSLTPPANSCGVSINVSGTWNTTLAKIAGINSASTTKYAGALGGGSVGAHLAIASLSPYARHTIYAGAIGNFKVNGSMFDNSVAQCNNRDNSCKNYPQCDTGTPTNNIICYGDSADVFQDSTESITGTLYSVAPVATDPCFYPSPPSGNDPTLSQSQDSSDYHTYGCGSQFSQAANAVSYGSIQGNAQSLSDPLTNLADPSDNGAAATECPGQSSVSTHATRTVTRGTLSPGVYTNTVTVTGSVTLEPCKTGGVTSAPGIYVFENGLEICPTATSKVVGSDVMLYAQSAPPSNRSDASNNTVGYCAPAAGSSGAVPDGITIGGLKGSSVKLTAPDSGIYKGMSIFQDRSIDLNVGLDDGWTTTSDGQGGSTNAADNAAITINGVIYDNSFTNEPSDEVYTDIGSPYGGPYGALCTGATSDALSNDPVPCPGLPSGLTISNTSGNVAVNGAVIVGAFGTQGGTTTDPLALTITYDSSVIPLAAGNLRLIF